MRASGNAYRACVRPNQISKATQPTAITKMAVPTITVILSGRRAIAGASARASQESSRPASGSAQRRATKTYSGLSSTSGSPANPP